MFGKKEVFMTNQMDQYGKARDALVQAGIDYRLKTVNTAWQGRKDRSRLGRMGEMEFELFYYLYVKKADEERARYVLREAFRRT